MTEKELKASEEIASDHRYDIQPQVRQRMKNLCAEIRRLQKLSDSQTEALDMMEKGQL